MLTDYVAGRSAGEADCALRKAISTEERARKCAVLWFGEILERRLFRELGYSSMQQYAKRVLGFSETRTGDFMRLARKLDSLPAVKAALPEIGYTKAWEILMVASARTEEKWVEVARNHSRRELVKKVKRVKAKAKKPADDLFEPPEPLASEVPVRVSVEFTPEQFARWEALLETLQKQGVTGTRADLLLDALATSLENTTPSKETTPRGVVHIHQCPDCARAETSGRPLGRADTERLACDATISEPGKRNTTTIPPKTRREVLSRDRHACQSPGCGRSRFLEVHHLVPRNRGGTNDPDNLITLCSACHRLSHSSPPTKYGRARSASPRRNAGTPG